MAQDDSFSITLLHEDVDKEKVKTIMRAKAAAGWMTFAAVMSGVSAGFNSTYYNYAQLHISICDVLKTELHDLLQQEEHSKQELKDLFEKLDYEI